MIKVKNGFIIGLFLFIIIGCEIEWIVWLQQTINDTIPKDEYHNIYSWIAYALHVLLLGPFYILLAIGSVIFMLNKIK